MRFRCLTAYSLLSALFPWLFLPVAVPAAVVLLPETTIAQVEQTTITPQTFEGRLDQNSQVLSSGSYYNVHTFEGQAGQVVRIDMESSEFDTFLWLLAPDGSVLAQNDDVTGRNSRIVITLPTTGTYILWANSYSRQGEGSYILALQPVSLADALWNEAVHLQNQGNRQFWASRDREALQFWEQALELYRHPIVQDAFPQDSRRRERAILSNLGEAYRSLGQYEQAVAFHEQALAIYRVIGDRDRELIIALNNWALGYKQHGQYEQAINFYEQSLVFSQLLIDG